MNKISDVIDFLDFWKGQKTKIGFIATMLSFLFNVSFGVDIPSGELTEYILAGLDHMEVFITSGFMLYGIIFKIIRKFK